MHMIYWGEAKSWA